MKKVAVVYITYDGILNTMCGVGVISRSFIDCFSEVREYFLNMQIDLNLHLVTPALNEKALGYNEDLLNESKIIAEKNGGQVHFILNGTDGSEQFGGVHNWIVASSTAANKAIDISGEYEETLVFCVDPPFMYTPHYIELQKNAFRNLNITSVIVPHSDVLSHEPENPDMSRLGWEASAIKFAISKQNIKFAKTSEFLITHLVKNYCIDKSKIIDLQTGLNLQSQRYKSFTQEQIRETLEKYKIPTDKDLIFSVGRAVSYKGFEILIESVSKIKSECHLVFIASPYKYAPSNVNELKTLLKKYKISYTAIYNLDLFLPSLICQWERTRIVAQLSLHEPFGLVPEEVRVWGRNHGPVILASNLDGYVEQIENEKDGFLVDLSSQKIADKIDLILKLSKTEIQKIRKEGFKRVIRDYDYRVSLFTSISQLLCLKNADILKFKETLNYDNLF